MDQEISLKTFAMSAEEKQKLAALKNQHGEIFVLRAGDATVYARLPDIPQMDCYFDEQFDEKKKARAALNLLKGCAVEPTDEGFDAYFAKLKFGAALRYKLAFAFLEVTGLKHEAELGK